jgi:hypothetical protein
VNENWHLQDQSIRLAPNEAKGLIRDRLAAGQLETWFESSRGRLLAIVTNGNRAMLMLLDEVGDAGKHLITADETGTAGGYVLSNGQVDRYPNRDTVTLAEAVRTVIALLATGEPPGDLEWHSDR